MCNVKWVIEDSLVPMITLEQRPDAGELPVLTRRWLPGGAGEVTFLLWFSWKNTLISGLT